MKNLHTIAVIGGTGKSGTYLVKELLERNYKVRLLVRNPEKTPTFHQNLEIVYGDVSDPESVSDLLSGSEAIVSALGIGVPMSSKTIFKETTKLIIEQLQFRPQTRYIVLSGLNVNTEFDQKSESIKAGTEFMYSNFPISSQNKQEEYEVLLESDLNWTLIRSTLIELTEEKRMFAVSTLDCKGSKIAAASLAQFMVDQLESEEFCRKAPFIWDK